MAARLDIRVMRDALSLPDFVIFESLRIESIRCRRARIPLRRQRPRARRRGASDAAPRAGARVGATARPDVSPIFIFLTLLIIEANTTIPLLIDL
ncbi:hypothetical protein [Burkholderia plantarii]|uniref:hypothetical protein n=1 Tax=Burkholderia plantarii TaxID=41899 RepID=UPI0018DBF1D6|nr:hypothetical protein [Burkholderia plantarii]MBI0331139.1 hypothetical protein [Burkholderia plantarii]